jgi:hypothetical protein
VEFLRNFLRNIVSWGISCGFSCEKTFPGEFPAHITAELPANCLQESFLWISSYFWQKIPQENFLRIQNSAGKPNLHEIPQEMCFLQIFCPNP